MSVRLSPVLAGLGTYPFVRLERGPRAAARRRRRDHRLRDGRAARGDAGVHPRRRSSDAITPLSPYPQRRGLPELRAAIAGWAARRFGVDAGPGHRGRSRRSAPRRRSSGSRNVFDGDLRRRAARPPTRSTSAARCSPASEVVELPLREENGWLPDLDAPSTGTRVAVLWLNYPNNPTGATAPLAFYEARRRAGPRARLRARLRRGLLASSTSAASRRSSALQVARPHATSPSSTRCPSARRCPATARGSSPATRRSSPR